MTPAFNERTTLPLLHQRLDGALKGLDWEWIIVDDHSRDDTFVVIERLASLDSRIRGIRLASNCGSHVAITCGLNHARGDVAALMVSDLQDPPELLTEMLERWRGGAQVVWAVRRRQPGEPGHAWLAAIYYWIVRRLVGLADMPPTGADFFVIDRAVVDAFRSAVDRHVSVFVLLMSLGFRQQFVEYDKRPRTSGRSGWTLRRKLKLVVDSVVGFSDFPIRWCLYGGGVLIVSALVPLASAVALYPGYAAALWLVAALLLLLSGVQLVAIGIVGQYAWRALEQARRKPLYAIEAVTGSETAAVVESGGRR